LLNADIKKVVEDAEAHSAEIAANAKIDQRLKEEAQKEAEKAAKEAAAKAKAAAAEAKRIADEQRRQAEKDAADLARSKKESYDALNRITIEGFSSEAASMASGNAKLERGYEDIKLLQDKGVIDAEEANERRKALIAAMGGNFYETLLGLDPESRAEIEQAVQDTYNKELESLQTALDQKLILEEEYAAKKAAIDDAYTERKKQLDKTEEQAAIAATSAALDQYQDLADGAVAAIGAAAGENSKAAKASFAVSKGLAIAKATMDAYGAFTDGMKEGGFAGFALAAAKMGAVMQQLASIKQVKGQFHDGINNVPSTGTYLLEQGERVVDKRLNQDLTNYLSGEQGGGIQISAPITIQGNASSNDRELMETLKRYPQEIARLVEDAQRRRG